MVLFAHSVHAQSLLPQLPLSISSGIELSARKSAQWCSATAPGRGLSDATRSNRWSGDPLAAARLGRSLFFDVCVVAGPALLLRELPRRCPTTFTEGARTLDGPLIATAQYTECGGSGWACAGLDGTAPMTACGHKASGRWCRERRDERNGR